MKKELYPELPVTYLLNYEEELPTGGLFAVAFTASVFAVMVFHTLSMIVG